MKKYKFIILINLFVFVLLIKLVDIVIFNKLELSYLSDNYKLNVRTYKENLDVLYNDPVQKKNIKLNTDNEGYILGDQYKSEKSNSIFFLGGSTTANIGVEAKSRFPYLFGKNIDSLNFKVYNAGVGGNHSFHSNLILLSKILKENPRPKYVFLHHNVNDISQLIRTQSYWKDYNDRGILQSKDQKRFSNPVINLLFKLKEFLIPNLYMKFSSLFKRNKSSFRNAIDLSSTEFNEDVILSEFKNSISLFINICRTYDITPILMTQYSRYSLDDNEVVKVHSDNFERYKLICDLHPKFNLALKDLSSQLNVYLIDLAAKIPNNNEYLYDEVHLNKKGNILASNIISTFFTNIILKKTN